MVPEIPAHLASRANKFPESSYGATTVTLILARGKRIENVVLSGARIVKVQSRTISDDSELDLGLAEIVDVVPADPPGMTALHVAWQTLIRFARRSPH